VTEAGRKGEMQDALDKGGIDLILLDIQMPEKSGLEWLAEIVEKQIAPVIMLTGFGSEEIAVQSIHEGAMDYIPYFSRVTNTSDTNESAITNDPGGIRG